MRRIRRELPPNPPWVSHPDTEFIISAKCLSLYWKQQQEDPLINLQIQEEAEHPDQFVLQDQIGLATGMFVSGGKW